jgi:hypothetical protein
VISVSRCAQRGASHPGNRPMTQGTPHRAPHLLRFRQAPAVAPVASRPSWPHHRLTRLISRSAPKPHLSRTSSPTRRPLPSPPTPRLLVTPTPRAAPRPTRATPRPNPVLTPTPTQTERNPRIHGKPFLTASNALADYSESPTSRTSRERIEGVSRSLPFSDLLALTSSHMFFSVMN